MTYILHLEQRESIGKEGSMEEIVKCTYFDLWKALGIRLRDLYFLQLTKITYLHNLLESGLLGRIISRLSRSKEESEGKGRLWINAERTKAGLSGLQVYVGASLLHGYETISDLLSFAKLQYPFLQTGANNAKIFVCA